MVPPYDALLVVSFGGPEGPDDVMPFLQNVLRGRNVPESRLREVAHHYDIFGGVSPINAQNRALISELGKLLEQKGPAIPIYWGNRNWHPFLEDSVRQMSEDGITRALAFVTSAFSSYSGCRQYREDILSAQAAVGPGAPVIEKLRVFYNHPGFIGANVDNVTAALDLIPESRREAAHIAFTAHSIPLSMAAGCTYEEQLLESCGLIAARIGAKAATGYSGAPQSGGDLEYREPSGFLSRKWQLVYQSRSGSPTQPWLRPDICDHLTELKSSGVQDVVIAPVGFVSDHMEVLYDLDVEARELCSRIGLNMVRASTPGTHPEFVEMIRELVTERMNGTATRRSFLGDRGASHDFCQEGCCPRTTTAPTLAANS